ncbi:ParB N-terminal domain-containing protein [Komagataeibacter sp. FNDCF1]|uniref:ParB N-terminal domain-containing protein n=1 Tax=Komagataeibacter sp. FNDCF1 TaxID=2878681 RepID=UPI001E51088A|nr:ParB N-terminal domain-containing protein [Komagataeibacter sp. FNDCF1]MCE2566201.1 ParB N-terminal domain-containing protein [Komagataeibacter sp. FNDCF1]
MNIEQIPVADIEVGERLRAVDPDWSALIAASMQENGQRAPIEVRKLGRSGKYALISGGHRLAAMKLAGIDHAAAIIVKASDLEAKLLEIDENLCRRELSPLDKATFLAERKAVYEELHPGTKHGGDRKSDQECNLAHLIPSFTKSTGEKLGIDASTIRRSIARYTHIMPDVREKITGTWLADSGAQLDELAKQEPDMQRQIADFVSQWPGVRKVSEIVRQLAGRPKPTPPGVIEKVAGIWRKASPAERKQIIEFFAPHLPGYQPEERAAA